MQNLPPATPSPVFATIPVPATSQPAQALASLDFAGQLALVQLGVVGSLGMEPRLTSDEPAPAAVFPSRTQAVSSTWAMSGSATWFDPGTAPRPMDTTETPSVPMVRAPMFLGPAPVPNADPIAVGADGVPTPEPPKVGAVGAAIEPSKRPIAVMPSVELAPTMAVATSSGPVRVPSPVGASPEMPPEMLMQMPPEMPSQMPSQMPWGARRADVPDDRLSPLRSGPRPELLARPSRPDEPPTEAGMDVAAGQPDRNRLAAEVTRPVGQADSQDLDRPSALPANPEMAAPLPDVPVALAPARRSVGRPGMDEADRDDGPSRVVDPPIGPVPVPAMTQTAAPPVLPTALSLQAHGGGVPQSEASVSSVQPAGIGSAGPDSGGAAPLSPDRTMTAPPPGSFEVPAEPMRRDDMDLAAKQDTPVPSAEAIAPPESQPQSQSLPPLGPSHRTEAPAPLAPDPRVQASVTDQLAPVMVSMGQAGDGAHRMTLRLNPVGLGLVEIRIDRPADAPAQVRIMVERPETLTLLLRDQAQLERALDQAGLPPDGRSLSIQVGPVTLPPPPIDPPAPTGQSGAGQTGSGANLADGSAGSRDDTPRQDRSGFASQGADGARTESGTIPGRPRWLRAGLDITA